MAQKTKVKELVGRGLNSYHTKALQQINRIEKKNKEQNHKISILSNELDNDYLTKTEEGSVISLEHSKEGMVYLDELQGNTLVNYCTDGSKEMTLNGDIDVEGTFVTTTEGVDNGQVDVLAEGNTMVNVCDQQEAVAITKSYTVETGNHVALQGEYDGKCRPVVSGNTLVNLVGSLRGTNGATFDGKEFTLNANIDYPNIFFNMAYNLTPGKTYTIIIDIKQLVDGTTLYVGGNTRNEIPQVDTSYTSSTGIKVIPVTIPNDKVDNTVLPIWADCRDASEGLIKCSSLILLEGDYTNKPIPDYFTGMQSSFEDKVVPENLSDIPNVETATTVGGRAWTTTNLMPAGEYTFIFTAKTSNSLDKRIQIGVTDTPCIGNQLEFGSYLYTYTNISSEYFTYATKITLSESKYVGIRLVGAGGCFKDVYLVEGDYTNYDLSDYDSTKAGKYKVEYKVTGKNKLKWIPNKTIGASTGIISDNNYQGLYFAKIGDIENNTISLDGVSHTAITTDDNIDCAVFLDKYMNYIGVHYTPIYYKQRPSNAYYVYFRCIDNNKLNLQIEEGSTATAYEPYKEQIKTYYLNSPLLEGDTIEQSSNDVVHVHRYGKTIINGDNYSISRQSNGVDGKYRWLIKGVPNSANVDAGDITTFNDKYPIVKAGDTWWGKDGMAQDIGNGYIVLYLDRYSDGTDDSKASLIAELQSNPVTLVYKLASPQYELISQNDTILTDSYVSGHLDFDTAVQVEKVDFSGFGFDIKYLYPSTNYIIQFEADNNGKLDVIAINSIDGVSNIAVKKGINKFNLTISSTITNQFMWISGIGFNMSNIVVTEATDKDFGYFAGMKSVGEVEENKIEILSQNKNLLDNSTYLLEGSNPTIVLGTVYNERSRPTHSNGRVIVHFPCKPNTKYYLVAKGTLDRANIVGTLNKDKVWVADGRELDYRVVNGVYQIITTSDSYYLEWYLGQNANDLVHDVILSETPITRDEVYKESQSNKKQILLNEPLRAVGDTKDRFTQIDGKWYVERNTAEVVLDNNNVKIGKEDNINNTNSTTYYCDIEPVKNIVQGAYTDIYNSYISDKFKSANSNQPDPYTILIHNHPTAHFIWLSFPYGTTINQALQYLANNPITVVYKLASPTYEPVEITPVLNTYSEVTHITNNSTIPMNMNVKNSGYNAIIKPSTLYTVALDTNKSGTIGLNLGGAKVTTTNNVATITTPATLSDDSLRLYGKGINGSKVRLLEGDKINWIPSFFEGMKSSFEDKFDVTDNTYKMEILMNNENLIPIPNGYVESSQSKALIENPSIYNELAKNLNGKTVTVSAYVKGENIQPIEGMSTHYGLDVKFKGGGNKFASGSIWLSLTKGILPHSGSFEGRYSATVTFGDETHIDGFNGVDLFLRNMTGKLTMKDITVTVQNNKEYIAHKSNKIQFSSIEPLRKWDRFVFKDNKLMIERNSYELDLNRNCVISLGNNIYDNTFMFRMYLNRHSNNFPRASRQFVYCDTMTWVSNNIWSNDKENIVMGDLQNQILDFRINKYKLSSLDIEGGYKWLDENPTKVIYHLEEPYYEEVPFELQKIILEGYENGTLFFDTNIPPTSTVTYAGETPIVKSVRLNKTEVLRNTDDINDNIIPYLMDMDYRVVMLQLATEELEGGVSMARLFGGTYEMIKRDILSKRLTREEYGYRLADYFNAGKLTEEQVRELEELR